MALEPSRHSPYWQNLRGAFGLVLRSFVLLLGVAFLLYGFCYSQFGSAKDDSFWTAYVEKIALLKRQSSKPRLILVGGSNCAFSIRSEILATELPFTPINLGLGISLPLPVWWRALERWGRKDDTVVLSLEVPFYSGERVNGELFALGQIAALDPGVFPVFWETRSRESLDRGLIAVGRIAQGAVRLLRQVPLSAHDFRRRSNFNGYGDLVVPPELNVEFVPRPQLFPRSIPKAVAGVERIVDRVHQLTHKQLRFLFVFPPATANYLPFYEGIAAALVRQGQTVLLPPGESLYPVEAFLDGVYHLKDPHRSVHSRKIALALQGFPPRGLSTQ